MKTTKRFMILFSRTISLMELLVVLTLGLILTGITSSLLSVRGLEIGPENKSAQEILTATNVQNLAKAILGDLSYSGYYRDMGSDSAQMLQTVNDLFTVPKTLPPELRQFNPFTKLGWRGPYLVSSGHYGEFTGSTFRFRAGFGATYGNPSDSAVLDAWGNPIVIQIDFNQDASISREELQYARLVSAGPNQILETPINELNQIPGSDPLNTLTRKECGDDLVFFLQVADQRK